MSPKLSKNKKEREAEVRKKEDKDLGFYPVHMVAYISQAQTGGHLCPPHHMEDGHSPQAPGRVVVFLF